MNLLKKALRKITSVEDAKKGRLHDSGGVGTGNGPSDSEDALPSTPTSDGTPLGTTDQHSQISSSPPGRTRTGA